MIDREQGVSLTLCGLCVSDVESDDVVRSTTVVEFPVRACLYVTSKVLGM